MSDDDPARMNTYLEAIMDLSPIGKPEHWVTLSTRVAITEACMAVADVEVAAVEQRLDDVVAEYQKAAESWDTQRITLQAMLADLRRGRINAEPYTWADTQTEPGES
jgi:hypothetical protein